MTRFTDARAYLNPDVVKQLRTLFGKAPNVHRRLALGNVVELHYVQKALSGIPIPARCERVVLARWNEWRDTFLTPPTGPDAVRTASFSITEAERVSRQRGAYYHPDARDPITERLLEGVEPFALLPDAGKFQ